MKIRFGVWQFFFTLVLVGAGYGVWNVIQQVRQAPEDGRGRTSHQFTEPGIQNPRFWSAEDVHLAGNAAVIGIEVNGRPRAYLLSAFKGKAGHHLVRDESPRGTVVVTHCDRTECTRVFQQPPGEKLTIEIGGWRPDQTMELIINGRRVSQKAQDLSLPELQFEVLTWSEWRQAHPDTVVYLSPEV